jgi:hypothetical protein
MPKFKRGDKVKVKPNSGKPKWTGHVGKVQRVSAYDGMVAVLLSQKPPFHRWGAKSVMFDACNLELLGEEGK